MTARVTVLGSGTSTGVPRIGCRCAVCTSGDPRNRRLRPGLRIAGGSGIALVDTPVDLRQQALVHEIDRVDAVVYTHAHADHLFGLDELRVFNHLQGGDIPCYGTAATLERIRTNFSYIFEEGQEGGGKPRLDLRPIDARPFRVLDLTWTPVPVWHGEMEVFGYRLGNFAYVTDCNRIPEESLALLDGVEILILDALRYRPHPTHFSIGEALEVAARLGPRQTWLTHLNHDVDYNALEVRLPAGVELAYDGLAIDIRP